MPSPDSRSISPYPARLRQPYWRPWLRVLGRCLDVFGMLLILVSGLILASVLLAALQG